jgi:acyl-CoA dehydrogenase
MRYTNGPDEVHLQEVARMEIKGSRETLGAAAAYLTPPEGL